MNLATFRTETNPKSIQRSHFTPKSESLISYTGQVILEENFNNLNYYSKVLAILVIVFVLLKFVKNLNVFEALLLSCIIAVSILIIENIIFINNTSSDPLNCSGCNISTINNDKIKTESKQSTLIVLPENEQKSLIIKSTNSESFTSIDSNIINVPVFWIHLLPR